MTSNAHCENEVVLTGLDGSNPLAFLAALGALKTLSLARSDLGVNMYWVKNRGTWQPKLNAQSALCPNTVTNCLNDHLRCGFKVDARLEEDRQKSQKAYQEKKTEIKRILEEIKQSGMKKEDRRIAEQQRVDPLRQEASQLRYEWLDKLKCVVPFAEMRLGKHLDAPRIEFRDNVLDMMMNTSRNNREHVDMVSAFASDGCYDEKTSRIQPSLFCFASGSGHQYFLDAARNLVSNVNKEKIHSTLFETWTYSDEKFSMRWDPIEDRRYALMWSDPTSTDNKTLTNWAANLLAYRGLQCLPAVPTKSGLKTTSFVGEKYFMWPIWQDALSADVVGSLLASPMFASAKINAEKVKNTGVAAIYRSERIIVGKPPQHKINFSPASALP